MFLVQLKCSNTVYDHCICFYMLCFRFKYGVTANEVLSLVSALAAVNCQSISLALIVHNTSIIYLEAVIRGCRH